MTDQPQIPQADGPQDPGPSEQEITAAFRQREFLMVHCKKLVERLAGEQLARGFIDVGGTVNMVNNELNAINNVMGQIYQEAAPAPPKPAKPAGKKAKG